MNKKSNESKFFINQYENKIKRTGTPTRLFNVGDKVRYGVGEAIVHEVLDNGYGYVVDYKKDGKGIVSYTTVDWTRILPINYGDTDFSENMNTISRLNFFQSDISGLLNYYYAFGIDTEPEYQRDYVWSEEDKEYLLDSIFNNLDIGKIVLVEIPDSKITSDSDNGYEILDGKQRLNAITQFFEDRITYRGKHYSELSKKDKHTFDRHPISMAIVQDYDKKTILGYFLALNRAGKSMGREQLERVEQLYNAEK